MVKPMCQVRPHQAIRKEKRQMRKRAMMMMPIAWPTERPWARKVLGACQLLMLRDEMVEEPKKRNQSASDTEEGDNYLSVNHFDGFTTNTRASKDRTHSMFVAQVEGGSSLGYSMHQSAHAGLHRHGAVISP